MCEQCVAAFNLQLSSDYLKDLPVLFRQVARRIFDGKLKPGEISADMVKAIAAEMWRGVLSEVETTGAVTPDLASQLRENIYVFSGFKNYQMLKEVSLMLVDESTGQRKVFNQFLQDVLSINETYNRHYLMAEYNHAIASAQMASNWQQYESTKEVAPYLKYTTAKDDRVRPAHAALDNVIKRIDSPFWDTFYPPNGWNCRCDVIQVMDGPETGEDFAAPALPSMFKGNVAKTGVIFPDTHPYYEDVPSQTKQRITQQSKELMQ